MPSEQIDALTAEIEKANPSHPAATAEAGEPEIAVEPPTPEPETLDTEGDEAEGEDGDETGEQGDTPTEEQPARLTRKQRRQARFNEAIVARRQAEEAAAEKDREAAYWRQKATEGTPGPAAGEVEKTLVDFNFDQAAYNAHLKEVARKQALAEIAKETEAEKIKQAESKFVERSESFRAGTPDYDAVALQTPLGKFYTPVMVETIRDSEVGPQLAYYLGQNLDKTDAILRMNPAQQARELGKIEARLEKPPTPAASNVTPITDAPPPRTVTRAPAVGSTVHASAPASKAIGDMSVQDHIEAIRVRRQR